MGQPLDSGCTWGGGVTLDEAIPFSEGNSWGETSYDPLAGGEMSALAQKGVSGQDTTASTTAPLASLGLTCLVQTIHSIWVQMAQDPGWSLFLENLQERNCGMKYNPHYCG